MNVAISCTCGHGFRTVVLNGQLRVICFSCNVFIIIITKAVVCFLIYNKKGVAENRKLQTKGVKEGTMRDKFI